MKCASSKCQFSLRFGTRSDFGTRMPRDWLSISFNTPPDGGCLRCPRYVLETDTQSLA